MTGRPCKPGSDLHGLWRLLLPGTAFPACGMPEDLGPNGEHTEPAALDRDDAATAAGERQRPRQF
jgi:hypothetical protein